MDDDVGHNVPAGTATKRSQSLLGARRLVTITQHLASTAGHDQSDSTSSPEYIPFNLNQFDKAGLLRTRWAHHHIKWMVQKDQLKQDMFLIGATGPMRRWLALRFCEILQREVEILSLTRDTTEADLKQRREIGKGGTVFHVDQGVVKAAICGRVLVLEGLEKVERNVLPVLNNLLENREMQLEDGRFLVASKRFDELLKVNSRSHLTDKLKLVRVHEQFRVIALGVPVPPFPGNPLDPPLRSRFQGRHIDRMPTDVLAVAVSRLESKLSTQSAAQQSTLSSIQELLKFYESLWQVGTLQAELSGYESQVAAFQHMVYPSERAVVSAVVLARNLKSSSVDNLISRIYPARYAIMDLDTLSMVQGLLPCIDEIKMQTPDPIEWQNSIASHMRESHASGSDLCLIAERGQGKSHVARKFAEILQYAQVETLHLYKDMTARDLLLRRSTNSKGETMWKTTPLVEGMKYGRLVILDGLDRLAVGTIAAILRLIEDREIVLFDGSRFLDASKYEVLKERLSVSSEDLSTKGIFPIHPDFRILALATPPTRTNPWFTNELLHLFHFFSLDSTSPLDYSILLKSVVPTSNNDVVFTLCHLGNELAAISADRTNSVSASLSLRQMIRVAKRSSLYPNDTAKVIAAVLLLPFIPSAERAMILEVMERYNFLLENEDDEFVAAAKIKKEIIPSVDGSCQTLRIGVVECPVDNPENVALVPDTLFFDMPKHVRILENMLKDFVLDEHILLLGNQGVGKNKLTDHLLMLLKREREYIQLHRDTTVQSLTLLPSLRNGVLVYEDSPLVKAMVNGRVLVIDEFDKAPTEVVCILKGLLEDGEVLLSDGRRFVSSKSTLFAKAACLKDVQVIHPKFKVFALANRPGYPFLGNDFFREMGDVFACHIVDAPDIESEIQLLQAYGPDVSSEIIRMLSETFSELRSMTDEGTLAYPYSTRELVSIVRHLQAYPKDNITQVLENMFAFDAFDPELRQLLYEVFQKHGLPLGVGSSMNSVNQSLHQLAVAELIRTDPVPVRAFHERFAMSLSLALLPCAQMSPKGNSEQFQERRIDGVASGRVRRFAEEILSFRVPHTGEVIGICALEGILMAITDTLELYLFDLVAGTFTSHSLVQLSGYVTSWGGPALNPILAVPSCRMVVTYDILNRQLLTIYPFEAAGICVKKMSVDLHPNNLISPRPVGMFQLALDDVVGLHAIRSNLIVIICLVTLEKFHVELPEGVMINKADCLGSTRLLLHCTVNEYGVNPGDCIYACDFEMSTASPVTNGHDFFKALQGVNVNLVSSEPINDDYATKGFDPDFTLKLNESVLSYGFEDTIATAPGAIFGFMVPPGHPQASKSATTWQYVIHPRIDEHDNELTADAPGTTPFLRKRRSAIWMRQSRLLVTIISSPMAIILEVLEPVSQGLRTIALSKKVTDDSAFIASESQRNDILYLRNEGMPHVIAATETTDGRLALLLTKGEIRLIELRDAELFAEETLWDQLVDGSSNDNEGDGEGNDQSGSSQDQGDGNGKGNGGGSGEGEGDGDGEGSGSGGRGKGSGGKSGSKGGRGGKGYSYSESRMREADSTLDSDRGLQDGFDQDLIQEAREKAREAIQMQQQTFDLDDTDESQYAEIYDSVQQEIQQLRVVLEAVESKEKERVWLKQQTHGDLDDNRLIDGATGDRNIYKKRGENDMLFGMIQRLPKRLQFVVDVSSSMSVMNGDGRLDRMCATVVMIMESFSGLEHKFKYSIVGHSGDSDGFEFVSMGAHPKNRRERLEVVRNMYSHATYCSSGDNTLPAAARAVTEVKSVDADDYFVFLISDANLSSYGISPETLAQVLMSDDAVNTYAIFIANKQEADMMKRMMPAGRAHTVLDTREMPRLFRQIFATAVL